MYRRAPPEFREVGESILYKLLLLTEKVSQIL